MDIASGDFTQRGQVSEDVLGNVVDAINLMVEEIGLVLTEFTETANSVRSGSGEMLLTTEAIAAGAPAANRRSAAGTQPGRADYGFDSADGA